MALDCLGNGVIVSFTVACTLATTNIAWELKACQDMPVTQIPTQYLFRYDNGTQVVYSTTLSTYTRSTRSTCIWGEGRAR